MRIPMFASFLIGSLTVASASAGDTWRYVVPSADDAFANPPPIVLALTDNKPSDVKIEIEDRGQRRRYAQLIYGTGRMAPVVMMLDEATGGNLELYVDADHNRIITAKELVQGTGTNWRVAVPAVVSEGEHTIELPRTIFLRYGKTSQTLAVATCGYIEGRIQIEGRLVLARRVDGDCNGLFADPRDRVWIDLDNDGRWDPVVEQHLFMPILKLEGGRFALRADDRGERLDLVPLVGFGTVKLALPKAISEKSVEEIHVTLQSRDGVVTTIRNLNGAIETPAGDYRVSSVMLTLADARNGPTWGFVFNDHGERGPVWHPLAHNGTLSIDPIGKLDFGLEIPDEAQLGESIRVQPTLYTDEGLRIQRAYRGVFQSFASGCHGTIDLLDSESNSITSASSGFA